jgi:DNA-binding response OmpR family regulator
MTEINYKKVLLIDDDQADHFLFKEAIKRIDKDFQLTVIDNGVEALDKIKNKSSVADIIFIDLNMRAMSGFELLVELRKEEQLKDVPLVVYSSSGSAAAMEATHLLGANAYLCKPVNFFVLVNKLRAIFNTVIKKEEFITFSITGSIVLQN